VEILKLEEAVILDLSELFDVYNAEVEVDPSAHFEF
jgi:hypothetical protein